MSKKASPPPLTDFEIREALRLQPATIRAVTEMLHMKGILHQHNLVKIKELRDAVAAEIRNREDGPQIGPLGRNHR